MFEVTVDDSFAAGHYLRNYKGKCENPHGHNYKVRVTLAGKELDKAGLLLDFKDLREVMKPTIDRLDHQMINDLEPFTVLNPSAENLAKYFYDETNRRLDRVTGGRVRVKNVTVFETDSTTATYSECSGLAGRRLPALLSHADHGDLQIDSGRVHACWAALRVRAADRMQSALFLVRQRIHFHRRPSHDNGRSRGRG